MINKEILELSKALAKVNTDHRKPKELKEAEMIMMILKELDNIITRLNKLEDKCDC